MIYEKMISTGVNQEMSSEDKVSDDRVKQKAGLDEPGKSLVVQGKRRLEGGWPSTEGDTALGPGAGESHHWEIAHQAMC